MSVLAMCGCFICGIQTPLLPAEVKPQPEPSWMVADKALDHCASCDVKGSSLARTLEALSTTCGVKLDAARDIREFRVSLHLDALPLRVLMCRLVDLFSHQREEGPACYWERTRTGPGGLSYVLRRTLTAAKEEADALDYPRRKAEQWLRDIRAYAELPPEKRKQCNTDCPQLQETAKEGGDLADLEGGETWEAVASLSDSQMRQLTDDGSVSLPRFMPSQRAVARMGQEAVPEGANLVLQEDSVHKVFTAYVWFRKNNPTGERHAVVLDPLRLLPRDDQQGIQIDETAKSIDLTAHLHVPSGKRPSCSLAAALGLLRAEAHLPIIAEIFVKRRWPLPMTTGKPERLLNEICRLFGAKWARVDGIYVVWDRDWVRDRAGDVPQPMLDQWQAKRGKLGSLEFSDLLEMARFNDRQVELLTMVFGLRVPFAAPNLKAIRAVASLPADVRGRALAEGSAELGTVSEWQMKALRDLFGRELKLPAFVILDPQPDGVVIGFRDAHGESVRRWARTTPLPGDVGATENVRP